MRILLLVVSLLLLNQQGCSFVVERRYFPCRQGLARRRQDEVHIMSRRLATLLDETDKLLLERMDSDTVDSTKEDWLLIQVVFTINVLLAFVLFSHGSPPIETNTAENTAAIERIQQPPAYNAEEDVTMWMDSSAGFFFY